MEMDDRKYRGYEYKKITADVERLAFLLDGYERFGWEQDENFSEKGYSADKEKRTILLRRDRRIINKMELTRLQRNFEACIGEIDALEKAKGSRATVSALIVGLIGTVFMACATFAVTAEPPHILLCAILSVPGFAGWILPYFMYKRELRVQTEKLTPLIDAKYEEIYEICEKGNRLSQG